MDPSNLNTASRACDLRASRLPSLSLRPSHCSLSSFLSLTSKRLAEPATNLLAVTLKQSPLSLPISSCQFPHFSTLSSFQATLV